MSGRQKVISCMVVLIGLLVTGAAPAEPRTALVIGNAAYADKPLPNPVNAARDMAKALEGMGFTVMLTDRSAKTRHGGGNQRVLRPLATARWRGAVLL